jgi:hypothetical protein
VLGERTKVIERAMQQERTRNMERARL